MRSRANDAWALVGAAFGGVAALAFGLFVEWRFAPFVMNPSFDYFVSHLHELKPVTLIMVAVGTLLGFWLPWSRSASPRR